MDDFDEGRPVHYRPTRYVPSAPRRVTRIDPPRPPRVRLIYIGFALLMVVVDIILALRAGWLW